MSIYIYNSWPTTLRSADFEMWINSRLLMRLIIHCMRLILGVCFFHDDVFIARTRDYRVHRNWKARNLFLVYIFCIHAGAKQIWVYGDLYKCFREKDDKSLDYRLDCIRAKKISRSRAWNNALTWLLYHFSKILMHGSFVCRESERKREEKKAFFQRKLVSERGWRS